MERLESKQPRATHSKPPEALSSAGFSDAAIDRLITVRDRYHCGFYSEKTIETKRLEFGKWLREHGRIAE